MSNTYNLYQLGLSGDDVKSRLMNIIRMVNGKFKHADGTSDNIIYANDWNKQEKIDIKITTTNQIEYLKLNEDVNLIKLINPENKELEIKFYNEDKIELASNNIINNNGEFSFIEIPSYLTISSITYDVDKVQLYQFYLAKEIDLVVEDIKSINDNIIVSPANKSREDYNKFNILCEDITSDLKLKFKCDIIPNKDIEVNLLILGSFNYDNQEGGNS